MKALVKQKAEVGLWMQDVPVPTVVHNEVLIKITKTAICGTDIHIYNWDEWARQNIPVPMTIGHEFVGIVEKCGDKACGEAAPGDRVTAEGHITCGRCRNCRAGKRHFCRETIGIGVNHPGGFAEYISVPADNVYKIPDDIDDDTAAVLDPFGNAAHTALSYDLVGEDVLITGAGPIGVMAAGIARHVGARHVVVTDINDYRLELASKMGATRVVNVTRENIKDVMASLDMKEGFDVGLEMSGSPEGLAAMLETMNYGGKVALLGILPDQTGIKWSQVIFKSLNVKGIYGREMFDTWYKSISMLQASLSIAPVITHRLSATDFQEGFEIMRSGQSGKVILDWT